MPSRRSRPLSELADRVGRQHERLLVTCNGVPSFVVDPHNLTPARRQLAARSDERELSVVATTVRLILVGTDGGRWDTEKSILRQAGIERRQR